jgi:exosome complex RNA-binding protein Rrp42 (RNase PH superfamily)
MNVIETTTATSITSTGSRKKRKTNPLIHNESTIIIVPSSSSSSSSQQQQQLRRPGSDGGDSAMTTTHLTTSVITEEDYIQQGCYMNCRIDGREVYDYRHYTVRVVTTEKSVVVPSVPPPLSPPLSLPVSLQSLLLPSGMVYSNGSSELYDTITNGTLIHLLCHIQAELIRNDATTHTTSNTTTTTATTTSSSSSSSSSIVSSSITLSSLSPPTVLPLIEISLSSNTTSTSSSSHNDNTILKEYESSLQQYYVPCLRNTLSQLLLLLQPVGISPPPPPTEQEEEETGAGRSTTKVVDTLFKLHVDVQVLSPIHQYSSSSTSNNNNNNNNNYSRSRTGRSTNSVYYLDAVTHVINAALYETMVPLSTLSSSMDSNCFHHSPQPLIPRKNSNCPEERQRIIQSLPTIITTHVMKVPTTSFIEDPNIIINHHPYDAYSSSLSGMSNTIFIADTSVEEANASHTAIHVVVVPTNIPSVNTTTTGTNTTSTDPITTTTTNTTNTAATVAVGAIWKTKMGMISKRILDQCITMTLNKLVPRANNGYYHHS